MGPVVIQFENHWFRCNTYQMIINGDKMTLDGATLWWGFSKDKLAVYLLGNFNFD